MHANARRRRFGARALGPGGHLGLQRLVVVFEKSRVGSKLEVKMFFPFPVFLDAWPGPAPASIGP